MASRLLVLFAFFALSHVSLEAADICEILDANYCFYFADSSCYISLCQCEACSTTDKVRSLLEDSSDNSTTTHERICPAWCPRLASNQTIQTILGNASNSTSELPEISLECGDLKKNCLAKKGYNGHCYFYEKNCEYRPEIARKGKSGKKSNVPKTAEECLKHQTKCSQKYKRHYSCKVFKKYCAKFNLPEISSNNSTITNDQTRASPLEQCLNFQKICSMKYRKHFACRQYRKKCKPFNLPEIHFDEPEVTQKPARHHKKMRKGHGMRKEHNETVVLTDELTIGNETLVETLLQRS